MITTRRGDGLGWDASAAMLAPVRTLVGRTAVGCGQAAAAPVPVAPPVANFALAHPRVHEPPQSPHHLAIAIPQQPYHHYSRGWERMIDGLVHVKLDITNRGEGQTRVMYLTEVESCREYQVNDGTLMCPS